MKVEVEFAVKALDPSQTEPLVKKALSPFPVSFNFGNNRVTVKTQDQSPSFLLHTLRSTGLIALIRGLSSAATRSATPYSAAASAVCIFEAYKGAAGWAHEVNKGVARLAQLGNDLVFLDVNASDLLPSKEYCLEIRECGDISDGAASTGNVYREISKVSSDVQGRIEYVTEIKDSQISDLIGRSVVLYPKDSFDDKNHHVAGIIARSAGVFENQKTICACSGKTLWEEASKL